MHDFIYYINPSLPPPSNPISPQQNNSMPTSTIDPFNRARARAMWLTCLTSAYRTALACTIVGCATLYGPSLLEHQVAFPAFSYVTVILVVTNATFGDAIRSCWLGFYATVQTVCPAILVFWVVGPTGFSSCTVALAVAVASMVVVLPKSTDLVAKRIGLGQIVIIYVVGFINGVHTDPIMHPIHVAASTAVGILACVIATLVPIPRLACNEVKQNCRVVADNDAKRLSLFVRALFAEEKSVALALVSQSKALSAETAKLLPNIKRLKEIVQWESFPVNIFRHIDLNPGERLQALETPLKGMELALTCIPSFPDENLDTELKEGLKGLEKLINHHLEQSKSFLPSEPSTVPEINSENIMKKIQPIQTMPSTQEDLPHFLFLFCMNLLRSSSMADPSAQTQEKTHQKDENMAMFNRTKLFFERVLADIAKEVSKKRLIPAFKSSLSLGMAVLFGLLYSKENGYWAGLPVAISLAAAREPTLKVANVKAQGTVLGTVYGVLGCFLFERFLIVRFASLLPWFLFTSFLQRSRLYGQAGGISAVIGAVLILGRRNFGAPSDFAIARIVETFIGLACSILVDLLFQPNRAAILAKIQVSRCLGKLQESIDSLSFQSNEFDLDEKLNNLKSQLTKLQKFIEEAEAEPNFWFLPFPSCCYAKLVNSLTKMTILVQFSGRSLRLSSKKKSQHELDGNITYFKEKVGSSLKSFQEITMMQSLARLETEAEKNSIITDLELGKSRNCLGEDEMEKNINSYLQQTKELSQKLGAEEDEEGKNEIVLSLSALAFCLINLIRETREVEEAIKDIVQWENPLSNVNLDEITRKIQHFRHL